MSWIVAAEDCSGALITIMMDPTMQAKQPILPANIRIGFGRCSQSFTEFDLRAAVANET